MRARPGHGERWIRRGTGREWRWIIKFDRIRFGRICIDGTEYLHDVVIDRGEVRARKKGPSKKYRLFYGHTPLSRKEKIPWRCKRLVIGTGAEGRLPIMGEVRREAVRRGVGAPGLAHGGGRSAPRGEAKEEDQRHPPRDVLTAVGRHNSWGAGLR